MPQSILKFKSVQELYNSVFIDNVNIIGNVYPKLIQKILGKVQFLFWISKFFFIKIISLYPPHV